ncbi:MAG TPA: radical SAM protein, partial [Candidatus Lokiarchaeia archaeon]|nr:radical SAM protein [Candidatus Lokiarchaeia archaeon]
MFVEETAKTLLKGGKLPARPQLRVDPWFWADASLNIYRGCEHACRYCDGLSEYYHVDHDFNNEIHVKVNAPDLLEQELRKSGFYPGSEQPAKSTTLDRFLGTTPKNEKKADIRRRGIICLGGGVSDSYCPGEKEYRLTRRCLEVLRDFHLPTHIITKSDLILRDLDLLQDINADTFAMVSFSFSTVDENIKRVFEPRSPSAQRRLDAMQRISEAGIPTGTTYMPVIPFITDDEAHIRATLEAVRTHGGTYYLFGGMTLKGGRQADIFYHAVEEHFPAKRNLIAALYQQSWRPPRKYYRPVVALVHYWGDQLSLAARAPRYFPPGENTRNLEVSTGLFNMAFFMW